jgi:hypothetical protein
LSDGGAPTQLTKEKATTAQAQFKVSEEEGTIISQILFSNLFEKYLKSIPLKIQFVPHWPDQVLFEFCASTVQWR